MKLFAIAVIVALLSAPAFAGKHDECLNAAKADYKAAQEAARVAKKDAIGKCANADKVCKKDAEKAFAEANKAAEKAFKAAQKACKA